MKKAPNKPNISGKRSSTPPQRITRFLFARFLNHYSGDPLSGDLEEEFRHILSESGPFQARKWYWSQIIKSLPSFIKLISYGSLSMLKNYIKIAFRNIKRHKGYSFINISGLAVGMACCLLITLWIKDELSFDRFHEYADTLYRVEFEQDYSGEMFHVNVTPHPLAPALTEELPEIVEASRLYVGSEALVKYEDKVFYEDGRIMVDPAFFKMFSYPLIRGDIETVFDDPYSLVISRDIAEKYFGNSDPLGKVLNINSRFDFKVTGVIENVPKNSSIQFEIAAPYEYLRIAGVDLSRWEDNNITTYIRLGRNIQSEGMGEKIKSLVMKHNEIPDQYYSIRQVSEIHLYSQSGFGKSRGEAQYLYIFAVIAFFILFIACINFMNLSTARSAKRAREVGLRKVVGALKGQVARQFYGESFVATLLAALIAVGLVCLLLPVFNGISGKDLSPTVLLQGSLPFFSIGIVVLTGLLAGSYPALYLSSFQPIKVIRRISVGSAGGASFRKVLVLVQFSLSITLIIGTAVVFSQLNYIGKKDMGFEKENLVYLQMRSGIRERFEGFKTELLQNPYVLGVAESERRPSFIISNSSGADWEGKNPESSLSFYFCRVGYDFFETSGIEIKEGREFSNRMASDADSAYIINEAAARIMGMNSPVGKSFSFWDREGTIIGVVKDFHFLSMRKKIEPLVLFLSDNSLQYVLVRIDGEDIPQAMGHIQKTWERTVPQYPFEYRFINQDFDALYRSEQRMGGVLKSFSVLAVFISCLGLFGLASYAAEQRTKEIGIRKVLGASLGQVGMLLTREFFLLVLAANLIAWPLSYFAMRQWLQDFAYRTSLRPVIFLQAAALALVIALATVGYQAVKAGLASPAQSLKYE